MDQPLISVIMTARNAGRFIGRAIDSALAQTWRNIELIVINDASEDNTRQIIEGYQDPRIIRLANEKDLHISASTNRAIAASHGEYIAILDSDDAWYPDKLQKQVDWLEAHPEDGACFTWVTVVDQEGAPWEEGQEALVSLFRQQNRPRLQWLHDLTLQGNMLCHPSVVYRRSALNACGLYDEMLAQLLDYEVYLRLLLHAGLHILCEPLMDYRRIHDQNTSNSAQSGPPIWRANNEKALVLCDFIPAMPDALFAGAFEEEITLKPFDPALAAYEKGRLLYDHFSDETVRRCGLRLIRDSLRDSAVAERLLTAGIDRFSLYRWMAFEDNASRISSMQTAQQSAQQTLRGILGLNRAYFGGRIRAQAGRLPLAGHRAANALRGRLRRHERLYMFLGAAKRAVTVGPREAIEHVRETKRLRNAQIAQWPEAEERGRQQAARFDREITFSVLVPLYNTPEKYLREMIESVQAQTYGRWELCLADGSDAEHAAVGDICREYAAGDRRIVYRKMERNLGFSGNTNACIDMSRGEYLALLDHDDLLHPSALFYVMEAICGQDADMVYTDEAHFHETPEDADCPNFKPDYSPDMLRSCNYICHLTVFSRALLEQAGGGFRSEYDGSQDYDLILRLTEKAKKIAHVPRILYLWRVHIASTASGIAAKPYALEAARKAIAAHLERVGLAGTVHDAGFPSVYDVRYAILRQSLVSIIIPTKDHAADLKRCIDSIRGKTTWPNWEIILVENNSTEEATFRYYGELETDPRIRRVTWEGPFNYSAINNYGVGFARGEYILLLNNDTEVITPDWIQRMLMFAQRRDVGAVGCLLYYPDDTVQHAGVILGLGGIAGHAHKHFVRNDPGYMFRKAIAHNLSAVTGACVMLRRDVWEQAGGLDESLAVAFNDVDLCLRIRQAGYLVVFTPFAELYHHESRSRGKEDTLEKQQRFNGETEIFRKRWGDVLAAGDPYYNPNLTLKRENFTLR